jgi:hypothetical protein
MPNSLPMFDEEIELYFARAQHERVLDIGPGEGKFGRMLRRVQPAAKRIAVELDAAYVEQYGLRDIYDEVLVMDATRLMDDVRLTFGAVIVGDVIEHLRKSAGTDLLNFLVYRSKVMFVKFPAQMLQNDWEGHASEAHVSVWSELDFASFDHIFVERDPMHIAIVRGYLNGAIEWLPQGFIRALGYESCTAYYNERPERWKRADRNTRWRQECDAALESVIRPGERFIMVDEEKSGLLERLSEWRIPFLEHDTQYYGMPLNDDSAINELQRQVMAGAKWLVIAQNSFWVLQFYPGLTRELHTTHHCEVQNDSFVVFRLACVTRKARGAAASFREQ